MSFLELHHLALTKIVHSGPQRDSALTAGIKLDTAFDAIDANGVSLTTVQNNVTTLSQQVSDSAAAIAQLAGNQYYPPPQAAAVGMNTLTLGPAMTLGENWFPFNFLGVTPNPSFFTQNDDGTISITGGTGFGAGISSAHVVGSSWQGLALRGGFYVEFLLKFTPTIGSPVLPFPAAWALDIGFCTANTLQWPGQATGFSRRIELDFMQWPKNSLQYWEGPGLIDWYGTINSGFDLSSVTFTGTAGQFSCASRPMAAGDYIAVTGTASGSTGTINGYSSPSYYKVLATNGTTTGQLGTTSGGAVTTVMGATANMRFAYGNITQPNPSQGAEILMGPNGNPFSFANWNRYGCLVVPATSTTQGSITAYLNGVQKGFAAGAPQIVWNQYDSSLAPPPTYAGSGGSLLDAVNLVLILGSSADCPMTCGGVAVWQASAALNLSQ